MSNSGLGYAIFITLEVVVVSHKCTKERLQIFAASILMIKPSYFLLDRQNFSPL